jgi:UDP-2,3-diacylglucosamine hydrolase
MSTLFISDLHLEDRRPQTTELLDAFLAGPARDADALYILGDLFEFWIGDDMITDTAGHVGKQLAALSETGIPCYFQHGNRDFLLASDYAGAAGLKLLPEMYVADLYGTPTLLLHGDTLCTDDVEYQAFRSQVRNPLFQASFLKMSPEQRIEMARNARDASKKSTGEKSMEIMDVNEQAVRRAFEDQSVMRMIHGHTHRPAFHQHTLGDGRVAERLVLSDWYDSGSYLRVGPDNYEMIPLNA